MITLTIDEAGAHVECDKGSKKTAAAPYTAVSLMVQYLGEKTFEHGSQRIAQALALEQCILLRRLLDLTDGRCLTCTKVITKYKIDYDMTADLYDTYIKALKDHCRCSSCSKQKVVCR